MRTENSGRLGDIGAYKIEANGKDITNAVVDCDIWQDIFTPTWSAALAMSDTNNMIHTVPLKQGTQFVITVKTKLNNELDGEKQFKFVLYKITDRQQEKSMHQSYVINLVHADMIRNQQKRVQKHFQSSASSIVRQVVSDTLGGSVETDSAEGSVNVIIPNWSPFVAANWCAMHAVSSGAADFCFFMSDDGKYKFKSMETMFGDDVGVKLTQRIADVRDNDARIPDDRIFAFTQHRFEHADALMNVAGGFYGNETNSYDFVKKTWTKTPFKFGQDCGADAGKQAFDSGLFGDSKLTSISYVPKHEGMFKQGENIYDSLEKWTGSRKSSFMKFDQDKLYVQIPGGVMTWKWLGKAIEVELPSQEDMSGEKLDKYYKGMYLVVAVSHQIAGEQYFVTLELVKKRLDKGMN